MNNDLLSIDQVLKELQVDEEQLKELIRNKEVKYVLYEARVKFPRDALLALKNQKMSSHTSQLAKQKRQGVKTEDDNVSMEKAMTMLKISRETLHTLILSQRLRTIEIDGAKRVPLTAIDALKIQMPANLAKQSTRKLQKRKPSIKRKY